MAMVGVQPPSTDRYRSLFELLESTRAQRCRLSFAEIGGLVGPLPDGARRRRQWWTNTTLSPQGRAWLYAGWKVAEVDLVSGRVTFRRVN